MLPRCDVLLTSLLSRDYHVSKPSSVLSVASLAAALRGVPTSPLAH